jgi:penicillin-binding protein 1C
MGRKLTSRGARRVLWGLRAAAFLLLAGGLLLEAAIRWLPFPEELYRTRSSALRITDRDGRLLRVERTADDRIAFPGSGGGAGWTRLKLATLAAEDKRFYAHAGVDGWALVRALAQNLVLRHIHSGASTITTQVVRLKESTGPRTWTLKCREAFRALQLERRRTKDEILALYLDHAPFGGNLVGVRAASLSYFDREPEALSLGEAALLAGLPNAPSRLRPDRHPDRARVRRDTVLDRLRGNGLITEGDWRTAKAEPVTCRRGGRSFEAPHFCDWLAAQLPGGGERRSTLDSRIQAMAERELARQAGAWHGRHVWGGAVVVLEVETGAIRAFAGSPDYRDSAHAGQVDGAVALRSPGSALKPLLYAFAFDSGAAVPESILPDEPLAFGGYEPVNFDGAWRGPVTCRQALDQSLNVPAMWLCRKVGLGAWVAFLERAGLPVREPGRPPPGLGLVIGDGRVRLLDLANSGAALARLGIWKPVRRLESDPPDPGRRILSPEACYLVADILSQDSRQMAFYGHCGDAVLPRTAWKTGTSSGYRDAWCLAWTPRYVVGVWMGNPDGSGGQGLTGAAAAVPVAAALVRGLAAGEPAGWYAAPPRLVRRAACPASGQPPGPACGATITGWAIAGVSDPEPCRAHQPKAAAGGGSVKIREPAAGRTYRHPAGAEPGGGLMLRADLEGEGGELFWFVNGTFAGKSPAGKPLLYPWPPAGEVVIACSDNRGFSDSVAIRVE